MTLEQKMNVIMYGIKVKMKRGDCLDDILTSYTKLTEEEKGYIRKALKS